MGTMASQITSLTTVYSTVYPGADQRKHQSSAPTAYGGYEFEFRMESGGQCLLKGSMLNHTMRYSQDVANYSKHDMQLIFRQGRVFCEPKFKGLP